MLGDYLTDELKKNDAENLTFLYPILTFPLSTDWTLLNINNYKLRVSKLF
jgi:hypothetical protein